MPALVTGITGILTAFKATAVGAWLTGTFTGKLLASVALSALQGLLVAPPSDAGFAAQYTATGGTNPCSFIVGFSATAGQEICPPMTHGKAGKTPNAYLTYVIKLGDIPGQSLQGMQIDGAPVTLGTTAHPDYGLPVTGRYNGYAWFKYYNGTQTVADPMLLAKYGSYPERPWLSDMIGTNMCYVIMTFRYNQELFGGLPQGLWECGGIPLYDPRKDTTVGGSGTHRWANVATWERSLNNAVINYNFARGVTLPSLGVWGGDFAAEDLPLATWFTAMNECDVLVDSPATPQFQAGYEVRVSMEPAGVMEEVGKGCTGQFAEAGGILKMRVGGPGLPVLFITDGDIIVSKPQDFLPFPGSADRQNGIEARFPDPGQAWQPIAAPPRYTAIWEAEDGARRVASIDLRACPYPKQVYRVMKSYVTDGRRARPHGMTLPPDAAILEPLDVISWTSTFNTYLNKLFEVSQVADDLLTILQRVSIRECDPADFVPPTGLVVPGAVSSAPVIPVAQTLPAWAVAPRIISDAANASRQPGIIAIWDGSELDDAISVQYELRVAATGSMVKVGTVSNVAGGQVIVADGVLRNTAYEMRGLLVVEGRASNWTAWTAVTSPNIAPVNAGDLGNNVVLSQNLTLLPGNMISNPQFATGDARDWRLWAGPQSVVPRATAGVPANAPTANVMKYSFGSITQISTFAGERAYNLPDSADCAIPVITDQSYYVTIDAAKSAAGTLTGFAVLMFTLGADGSIGSYTGVVSAPVLTSSFVTYSGVFTAPASVVAVWPYVFVNMTGAGEVYWTKLSMRTMTSSSLVDVPSFSTAGLAIFGGQIKSGIILPGGTLPAWEINSDGTARFQQIVTDEAIITGAISKQRGIRKFTGPVSVASSVTSTILGNTLSFPAGTYKQLVREDGLPTGAGTYAINPIAMSGLIQVFGATGVKARLELDLQYTNDGVSWYSLTPGFDITLIAAQASDGQTVSFYIVVDASTGGGGSSSASLWTGLRLGARTNNFTPFTGAAISVGAIQSVVRQLNK